MSNRVAVRSAWHRVPPDEAYRSAVGRQKCV